MEGGVRGSGVAPVVQLERRGVARLEQHPLQLFEIETPSATPNNNSTVAKGSDKDDNNNEDLVNRDAVGDRLEHARLPRRRLCTAHE